MPVIYIHYKQNVYFLLYYNVCDSGTKKNFCKVNKARKNTKMPINHKLLVRKNCN